MQKETLNQPNKRLVRIKRDFFFSPRTSMIENSGPSTPEHRKCFKVAQELLTTERTYVKILHLIDQIFHFRVDQENRVQNMFPPETITQMFCNTKSLYRLHNDHLLPKLEERLGAWDEVPRIGKILLNSEQSSNYATTASSNQCLFYCRRYYEKLRSIS